MFVKSFLIRLTRTKLSLSLIFFWHFWNPFLSLTKHLTLSDTCFIFIHSQTNPGNQACECFRIDFTCSATFDKIHAGVDIHLNFKLNPTFVNALMVLDCILTLRIKHNERLRAFVNGVLCLDFFDDFNELNLIQATTSGSSFNLCNYEYPKLDKHL